MNVRVDLDSVIAKVRIEFRLIRNHDLAREEREHTDPWICIVLDNLLDGVGDAFERAGDRVVQSPALVGQFEPASFAVEQR